LFDKMFDEGWGGEDYDDQIRGSLAAGLIAARAKSVEDALVGARAYHDPTGSREAEDEGTLDVGKIDWTRDDFEAWLAARPVTP
jgi:hypothetical protein